MKSIILLTLLGLAVFAAPAIAADCKNAADADDAAVSAWFKTLGCQIVETAKDVKEAATPYAEKVSSSVSHTYDNIKHKLTDKSDVSSSYTPVYLEPTEKVPLAPLSSGPPSANIPDTLKRDPSLPNLEY